MAKWNVYAPDGLVEELRAQDAQVNLSALFQQAIHTRLAELGNVAVDDMRVREEVQRARLALRRLDQVLQAKAETGRG